MKKYTLLFLLCVLFSITSFAFISQGNWRLRNNNSSEITATWKAPENIAITISSSDSILRLRIQLQNTTGDVKNFNTNLQVASAPEGPWRYAHEKTPHFLVSNLVGFEVLVKSGELNMLEYPISLNFP